jgi:hypothetical protein
MLIDTLQDEQRQTNENNIDLICPQSIIRNVFVQHSTLGTSLIQFIIGFCHHGVRTKQMINDEVLRIMTMVEMTSIVRKSIESEVFRVKEKLLSLDHIRDETMVRLRTIAESHSPSRPFDNNI